MTILAPHRNRLVLNQVGRTVGSCRDVGTAGRRPGRGAGARARCWRIAFTEPLVEWPGGDPVTVMFNVSSVSELHRKTLDTDGVLPEDEAAAVPCGSHGILRAEGRAAEHVLVGPALFGENQTVLRIAEYLAPDLPDDPMSIARQWRAEHGTEAVTVNGDGH